MNDPDFFRRSAMNFTGWMLFGLPPDDFCTDIWRQSGIHLEEREKMGRRSRSKNPSVKHLRLSVSKMSAIWTLFSKD